MGILQNKQTQNISFYSFIILVLQKIQNASFHYYFNQEQDCFIRFFPLLLSTSTSGLFSNNKQQQVSSTFLQDTLMCVKRFQSMTPEAASSNTTTTTATATAASTTTGNQATTTANPQVTTQSQQQQQPAVSTGVTLGFLGCGNMSAAILKGLVKAAASCPKEAPPVATDQPAAPPALVPLAPGDCNSFLRSVSRILVFDPSIKPGTKKGENFHINLKKMNPNLTFEILDSAEELAERSSVAVIGVKPQVARTVLYPLRGLWGKRTESAKSLERPTVVISVIAGETIISLEEMLQPPEFTERIRREEEMALKQIELDDQIDANDELMASNPDLASAADLDPNEKRQQPPANTTAGGTQTTTTASNAGDYTPPAPVGTPEQQQQQQQIPTTLAPLEASHLCVVRSMPNTPLLVGKGVSGYSISTDNLQRACGVTTDQAIPKATEKFIHDATAAILGSAQNTLAFVPESQLDAVSGVSGCGPAFVSMVVESLADGGVMQGLPRALANRLAAETVHGASAMLCGDRPAISSAAEMRHQVCSPGGATIAGVHKLEEKGLRDALMCAVRQSATRCGELRREGEQQATIMRKKQRVAAIKKKKHNQYYALQKSQVKKRSGSGGRSRSPGNKK